ncbi:MAG: Glu/Leu/Phe/Val dehydrogenase dimerization domain-containing protein [Bacteroidota bacterium]
MNDLLRQYKQRKPVIVFEWQDSLTEAKGWVVINSLRNGAAGGGTRMRKGLNKEEVISLAKVMEIKFSVCGPDIGGAKSGIDFDPKDPRRTEVLQRWYQAVFPLLKNYYGTGGDLNVDELKDVIPITEDLGLWHPQEGIVNGHLQSMKGEKINILGQLRYGCSKIIEDVRYAPYGERRFAVADMITGYGVAKSVLHFYAIFRKEELTNKRVMIQGWGNVAAAAGYYLASYGAKIVGIVDKEGGILAPEGLSLKEVTQLFLQKAGNKLASERMLSFAEVNEKIWSIGAEIFIPGAASKLITRQQVDAMIEQGLEVISCGANVPFIDDEVFFGPTAKYADTKVSLIPDYIANCGMARVFAYLMQPEAEMTDQAIFEDVSETIKKALLRVHHRSPQFNLIASTSLESAINSLQVVEEESMTDSELSH